MLTKNLMLKKLIKTEKQHTTSCTHDNFTIIAIRQYGINISWQQRTNYTFSEKYLKSYLTFSYPILTVNLTEYLTQIRVRVYPCTTTDDMLY